jgi:hypothetical protein
MATVNKNFKIKQGLVVEGTTATVDGNQVLTETASDQYIIDLIGGETLITSVSSEFDVTAGELSIDRATVDAYYDPAGAAANAESYADGVAGQAYSNAQSYADGVAGQAYSNAQSYADGVSSQAQSAAESYADGVAGQAYSNAQSYADGVAGQAQSAAESYADGVAGQAYSNAQSYADGVAGQAYSNAQSYADTVAGQAYSNAQSYADGVASQAQSAAESTASGYVSTHEGLTSGVHGVTGDVVGTTDIQDLSNKRIIDTLNFSDGVTIANEGEIAVLAGTHEFEIKANDGPLHLKTIATGADVVITSDDGDIVLEANGSSYLTSVSAGNEIATHSYVDNAISGLDWKQAVNLLATADVNMTGNTGTLVIDGHAALDTSDVGYRILLTAQAIDSENGIYEYTEAAGVYTLTRTADADTYTELIGAAVFVMEGTSYGQTSWVQSDHYLTDFTSQEWTQFSGSGSVVAGDGITVDGLEVSIDRTTVDTWYDPAGAAGNAQSAAESYADGVAGQAYSNAQSYADGVSSQAQSAAESYADGVAGQAYSNAQSYADGVSSQAQSAAEGYADGVAGQAYSNAQSYADGVAGQAQSAAESYADGVSSQAQSAAESYADGVASQAYSNAQSYADGLDTDDIEEGATNEYFTDVRAKTSAANLLTSASLTNITITGDETGLTITAENGVADSDTDDLTEGTTNLYFTDQRAVDALEAVVPNFTAVEINSLAKQVAATIEVATASQVTAYSFAKADYRSAKFLIKTAYGSHTELTEVLLTLDSSDNIAITEYATIGTNGSSMTVTADISGTDVRLRVTTLNNTSDVTVVGTLLA